MALTTEEKRHVEDLSNGAIEPTSGMERHFINVINGNGQPVTAQEKEWVAYVEYLDSRSEAKEPGQPEGPESAPRTPEAEPPEQSKILSSVKRQITDIEFRTDISDDQKVSQITHIACAACAGIAIQPIPFADIFILTPIQAYFGTRIAAIRGVPITESAMQELIREIFGVIGLGVIAQQIAIAAWKVLIPGGGGFVTVPLVYALTYAIMKVIDLYFIHKVKGQRLSDKKIKEAWREAFKKGKKRQKDRPSTTSDDEPCN